MSTMNRFGSLLDRLTYWRRTLTRLSGLLVLILVAAQPAPAGTIYFYYGGSTNPPGTAGLYAVGDSGATAPTLLAAGADFAGPYYNSARGVSLVPSWKTYTDPAPNKPATRRWLVVRPQGTDPPSGITYGELAYFTLDANGVATTVPITDFASSGLLIPPSGYGTENMFSLNWSSDGDDSFVSFTVLDPTTNTHRHVRLNILGTDLPTPANPYLVTPTDPRVQTVLRYSAPYNYRGPILSVSWRSDATKLGYEYHDVNLNYYQLRAKSVGPAGSDDTLMADTMLVDSRTTVGGYNHPRWSPTADRILADNFSGSLYTLNAVAGATPQLLVLKPSGALQRADWSPDGTFVAFDTDSFKGQYNSPHTRQIAKAPATGGKNVSAVSLTSSLDPYGDKVMASWRP